MSISDLLPALAIFSGTSAIALALSLRSITTLERQLTERNRRLVMISALETERASHTVRKMARIARGTSPEFRRLGKTQIRPRAVVKAEAEAELAAIRAKIKSSEASA